MLDIILQDHPSTRCTNCNVLLLSFKIRNKISSQIEWPESKASRCIQNYTKQFPQMLLTFSLSSSQFPLFHSNYQHCCRFCHFTSKTAFLIESPLSFSSKLPQLSWRLARRSFYLFPFPNFPSSSWWRAGTAGVAVVRFSNPLQCKSGLVDPSAIGLGIEM